MNFDEAKMTKILKSLGISGYCVSAERHRHLAFFDIRLSANETISSLENRRREIALAIRSKTNPVIKVITEEGVVRLQFAMRAADKVSHASLMYSSEFSGVMPIVLGEDETGKKLVMDMAKNPHLLIAGGTGSGKSTLLHAIIASAMYMHAAEFRNVKLYLVDPKRVEFSQYSSYDCVKGIYHTYNETTDILKELISLMENRYSVMARIGMRSIEEKPWKFPIVMVVIDEVADLMIQDKSKNLESLLVALAQKGRAAGIFITCATQRPSVDVITGLIKANFPGRIACKTASKTDSRVIFDESGAEDLMGRGDAILKNMEVDRVRFQVAYTDFQEIQKTYTYLKGQVQIEKTAMK
jgi:DNA segregation ATPase FtsK/SpoIIIE, S-DNA-T family